jgi:hypothetical protein
MAPSIVLKHFGHLLQPTPWNGDVSTWHKLALCIDIKEVTERHEREKTIHLRLPYYKMHCQYALSVEQV